MFKQVGRGTKLQASVAEKMHLVLGNTVINCTGSRMPASTSHEVPQVCLPLAFVSTYWYHIEKLCPKTKPLETSAIKNT